MTTQQLFEEYRKLDLKDQIIFERKIIKNKEEELVSLEIKRLELANDLEQAGVSSEWVMKNILNFK